MHFIAIERNRIGNLVWLRVNPDVDVQPGERVHHAAIEHRDGLRLERHAGASSVADLEDQRVIDEIEVDLKDSVPVGNRRGRQPSRGDVERAVPPMIDRRALPESNLADDLRPHVERRAGVGPAFEWQRRPELIA